MLNNWTTFYVFFAIVFCRFVLFICSCIKRCGLFFQRHKLLSDSTHCRRLRFCLSDRSVCTSFKQKCSYLKHCHGDLRVSFISAQKLCCAINGESKYLFSEFRICGNFSIGSLTVFRGPHLWCLWYFLNFFCTRTVLLIDAINDYAKGDWKCVMNEIEHLVFR